MASNASHSVSHRVTLRISHTKEENESEGTFSHREKLENTGNELSNQKPQCLTLNARNFPFRLCLFQPWKENEIFPNWESRSTWWNRKLTNTSAHASHFPSLLCRQIAFGVVVLIISHCACVNSREIFFPPSRSPLELCLTIRFNGNKKPKAQEHIFIGCGGGDGGNEIMSKKKITENRGDGVEGEPQMVHVQINSFFWQTFNDFHFSTP